MRDEIPLSWAQGPIGTFTRIVGGGTPPSKDPTNFAPAGQGIPWITPADLSGYRAQTIERGARDLSPVGLAACGATLMPKGTVLFSSRAPIGYVAIAANEISTNQGFKSFILPDGFDPRFTYYQLKHLKPEAEAIATGTTFKELSGAATATLPFKVAPLSEQTRIADQLDKLLARVQACNDRIDTIPALLKRFRQAVLSAAISGELSPDMSVGREAESSYGGSPTVMLGDLLAEPLRNGKSVRDGSGLPVLRLTSLKAGGIDLTETKKGDWSGVPDVNRFLIQNGDYLVSRGNGSMDLVGRGALVSNCEEDIAFPDTMIRIRLDAERVHLGYLKFVWSSQLVRRQIERLAKTTAGIWKVSQPDIESIRLPLPNLNDQQEIVLRVEALFKLANHIDARYTAARTQAQRLTPLLLAKAFRGELVPQDPNGEPASVLLERISTERSASPTQPRHRQSTTGRKPARVPKENAAMTKSRQDDDVKGQPYLAKHLRLLGGSAPAETLFNASELSVADFYKQLAWEVAEGHVMDGQDLLEPRDAA